MNYRLRLSKRAERYLERLDRPTQERMTKALRSLAVDPFGRGTKPLTNLAGERAMRVGGWRVIYSVDESAAEVHVDSIGPRGQVYRDL